MKKLYRSETNKIFFGIIGGMGEYTLVDATVLRLIYALFSLVTGFIPGLIFYMIALFIIPRKDGNTMNDKDVPHSKSEIENKKEEPEHTHESDTKNKIA